MGKNNKLSSSSSWGRILLGHIMTVLFGGLALVSLFMIFGGGFAISTIWAILLLIVGIIGAIGGFSMRSRGSKISDVDDKTGHAIKRKL